ncbi:MAG: PspC domain-containing protein [Candidatus Marinimicrobia bacterium]|nr:PspC domain-containing protein [Candidatus Neomarinimicrobiota bacterium]
MKRIYRSQEDRIIAGVCGGFAEYFGIDPTIVRLVWIFFTIFGGMGILAYIFSIILISENVMLNKNKIKTDSDQDEKLVLWGVVIIIVGIFFFFRHRPLVSMLWDVLDGNLFSSMFAIVLIGAGIYILLNRKEDRELSFGGLQVSELHLSETDKKLAGVCGGIAESIKIDSTIMRLIWVLGSLLSAGIGIVLYIVCMIIFSKPSDEIIKPK